jgi:hypothetical protein
MVLLDFDINVFRGVYIGMSVNELVHLCEHLAFVVEFCFRFRRELCGDSAADPNPYFGNEIPRNVLQIINIDNTQFVEAGFTPQKLVHNLNQN